VNDGKNIFDHLSFWAEVRLVENQYFSLLPTTEPCDKIEPKAAKPVFVGNDNKFDSVCENSVQ